MCDCGCNTCETKGPLLTEGKVKSLLSEGLQYHIDKQIPLFETVYRIGSDAHLALIKEARKMYSRNVIDLCEEDEALIKTHLGEFGLYKGESVPLDLPMLNEQMDIFDNIANEEFGMDFDKLSSDEKDLVRDKIDNMPMQEAKKLTYNDFVQMVRADMMAGASPDEYPNDEQVRNRAKSYYNDYLRGVSVDELFEAEFRGKEVSLNKPKRGGSKAYYVYVRDPKTKKIKKVSFGSGGLKAKIRNKKARNAFAARHDCKNKKDRTKASYWSCNLPRYAPALGLGAKMNTFW